MNKLFALLIAVVMTTTVVWADEDDDMNNMSPNEQADVAGSYFGEIIKYIKENYVGDDVDVNRLVHAAVRAVVDELDDYSDYLTPQEYELVKASEKSVWYAPSFSCEFNGKYPIIKEITQGSKAYRDGVRAGDEIRSINGVTAYGIGEEEYASSVISDVVGSIQMKISRGTTIRDYTIDLLRVEIKSVEYEGNMSAFDSKNQKFTDSEVGYIKIKTFTENTAEEFRKALNSFATDGKKKLILDLRGNTGGYVDEAIDVAKMIVPSGVIISARDKKGNVTTYSSQLRAKPYNSCVVLVDSMTASSAEIVASAMQDSGAGKIVGEKTFGKGVMQSIMSFDDIGVIKMTTMEYSSRYGKKINGIGITPDITVDKIMFVSEEDSLDSKNVVAALRFLGFKVDKDNSVERNLGRYQSEMNLDVTYKLDGPTVSAMNYEIFTELSQTDRILAVGYLNLLS